MSNKKFTPSSKAGETHCFFMASVQATFVKDEAFGERTVNVMIKAPTPIITQSGLQTINQQVMQRLNAENEITPDMMQDIVILNVVLLGQMTDSQFHDMPAPPAAEKPSETAA